LRIHEIHGRPGEEKKMGKKWEKNGKKWKKMEKNGKKLLFLAAPPEVLSDYKISK
jgi:hypothetical protein